MQIEEYLKGKGVRFRVVPHEQAFTAQEVAAVEHVTGHMFAKTVIAKGGDRFCMLVLPAHLHVDFDAASRLVGEKLELASEPEMKQLFADCEVGAEPPFGGDYGLHTYVDRGLTECAEIVFRAGTHDKTIKMGYADWATIEEPEVGDFAAEEQP